MSEIMTQKTIVADCIECATDEELMAEIRRRFMESDNWLDISERLREHNFIDAANWLYERYTEAQMAKSIYRKQRENK